MTAAIDWNTNRVIAKSPDRQTLLARFIAIGMRIVHRDIEYVRLESEHRTIVIQEIDD